MNIQKGYQPEQMFNDSEIKLPKGGTGVVRCNYSKTTSNWNKLRTRIQLMRNETTLDAERIVYDHILCEMVNIEKESGA